MLIINEKKYLTQIPAGVSDGQIIQVEATASGEPKRKLTVQIHIDENAKENGGSSGCGMPLWLLASAIMLFAMPPVGIGMFALATPFLFLGKKK